MEESQLIDRARQGDVGAYESLVRLYQNVAFRTAYLVTGDAADAEDAAQEAFTKAYFALSRFRPGAPFRPWLLRIVANEARNRRTSASRQARLALRAAEGERAPANPSPETVALQAEQQQALFAALLTLRAEEQTAIAYRYFLDLSEAEMADLIGCARGTVKSRLSRALRRLRERLASAADPDSDINAELKGAVDG